MQPSIVRGYPPQCNILTGALLFITGKYPNRSLKCPMTPSKSSKTLYSLTTSNSTPYNLILKFKSLCDRHSQSAVLVLGPRLGHMITVRYLRLSYCRAPFLTRGWICNVLVKFTVTLQSNFRRTHENILLFHFRPLGFLFCRFLRLAGLRWKYPNSPPRGNDRNLVC
jgi:hypothetical protein